MKARNTFILTSIIIIVSIILIYFIWRPVLWSLIFFGPLILIGYSDILQHKQAIRRNFPVIGHGRYLLESLRPEIMQYFVETDTEGRPINRIFRTLVYQRSKKVNDTSPFGTQMDVYKVGYEWIDHSIYAKKPEHGKGLPRIKIGGRNCRQPYSASLLNISAMSYGALSKNAIMAMNKGAGMGNFAQNTGEGGTGAAPVEFSNSLGMPLREGLAFAYDTLTRFNLKKDIKLIASGKILSGFHIARVQALGADLCNSARAMMLATGCIQALQCNNNTCPVGVATQNKQLMKGLNVEDKAKRVCNFHHETLRSFIELMAAAGISGPSDIGREHINRRVSAIQIMNYAQIYPYVEEKSVV